VKLAEGWQRIVEKLHSGADRCTHTWDRRRAAGRARRRGRPRRVVVVCYGNICRSPYAAAYLRRQLMLTGVNGIEVESAGFFGPGPPANSQGAAIALRRGLDLRVPPARVRPPGGARTARPPPAPRPAPPNPPPSADAEQPDLVLAMTRLQQNLLVAQFGVPEDGVELLGDFDNEDPPYREIPDPYGKSDAEFERVFSQIERSVDGLCEIWAGYAPPPNHPGR
jgi:protein-tyrosine phosphatase